jgi:hypothetical protein
MPPAQEQTWSGSFSGQNGRAISYTGTTAVWTFLTREDNGWQIEAVTPYPWCGGYVTASACD